MVIIFKKKRRGRAITEALALTAALHMCVHTHPCIDTYTTHMHV